MRLLPTIFAILVASTTCAFGDGDDRTAAAYPEGDEAGELAATEDLAGSLADMVSKLPRRDVPNADPTIKALGGTLLATAAEHIEADEDADPLEIKTRLETERTSLSDAEIQQIKTAENSIEKTALTLEKSKQKEIPTQTVYTLKDEKMRDLDTNNDGELEESELIAQMKKTLPAIRRLQKLRLKKFQSPEIHVMFNALDTNHDGFLSATEAFGAESPGSKKDYDQMKFKLADSNHDSKLTPDEFFVMINPEFAVNRKGYWNLKAADHMIVMDTKKTGKVTWAQYRRGISNFLPPTTSAFEKKQLLANRKVEFGKVDEDHDGQLDITEMQNLVARSEGQDEFKIVIDQMIKIADDNHDGKLSLSEIIGHSNDFGSNIQEWFQDPKVLYFKASKMTATVDASPHTSSAFDLSALDLSTQP